MYRYRFLPVQTGVLGYTGNIAAMQTRLNKQKTFESTSDLLMRKKMNNYVKARKQ